MQHLPQPPPTKRMRNCPGARAAARLCMHHMHKMATKTSENAGTTLSFPIRQFR